MFNQSQEMENGYQDLVAAALVMGAPAHVGFK
jgi:hypothetical protein